MTGARRPQGGSGDRYKPSLRSETCTACPESAFSILGIGVQLGRNAQRGQILLQEDPGVPSVAPDYLATVWEYRIDSDTLKAAARHNPERFVLGEPRFLTRDEESSGIIDVSHILGEGWFLLDVQAPYTTDTELVAGGQLLALHVPPKRR